MIISNFKNRKKIVMDQGNFLKKMCSLKFYEKLALYEANFN